MWKQKLNERTLELEDGPPSFFQDLCGSLPCASSAAWWTSDTPCVSTKSKQRRSFSWFSAEAMVKGYQAYRDSWATALSKEMPCPREVGNWVNFSLMQRLGREAWPSKARSLLRPAYVKIKTTKSSSTANTAFSQNIAPAKISHYMVHTINVLTFTCFW